MSTLHSILSEATSLPIDDRLQLIEARWATVAPDESVPVSEEWRREIAIRSEAFDAGIETAVPWKSIEAQARERLRAARES